MEKIVIKKLKTELKAINADSASTDIILNNCSIYNDLVKRYDSQNSELKIMYLICQINGQILKQINAIKALNKKLGVEVQEDNFTIMMKELKGINN